MDLIVDIEADGLLDAVTRIHCLVLKDTKTGHVWSCHDHEHPEGHTVAYGLGIMAKADTLIAHNGLDYDIRAIRKVLGVDFMAKPMMDTLLLSKLIWPALYADDAVSSRPNAPLRWPDMPARLRGRHGLEAWGYRLGLHKGDYKAEMEAKGVDPWSAWNPEMQSYCEQDVEVTERLWNLCTKHRRFPAPECIETEHQFKRLMLQQEENGIRFDEKAAAALLTKLTAERDEVLVRLREAFPSRWRSKGVITPTKTITYADPMRPSTVAGAPYSAVKWWQFDPARSEHIVLSLQEKHRWNPRALAKKTGKPKTDEDTLSFLPYPEVPDIIRAEMLGKRIGQLSNGAQALMQSVRNGRLHGQVDTLGTKTRRCSHSRPNLAQVPKVGSSFGAEFRSLFVADAGYTLFGFDAAGIQLRALAHYLARYDGGSYVKAVSEGDIHTTNQEAWQCVTRNQSKTLTYSYLFGCFPAKTGNLIIEDYRREGKTPPPGSPSAVGERHRAAFEGKLKLDRLLDDMWNSASARGGYLKAIDGGLVLCNDKRTILSAALQSAEACIMKLALVLLCQDLAARGWDAQAYRLALNVHDEAQINVLENLKDELGEAAISAIRRAGERLNFRCPLSGEYKSGNSWFLTH